MTNAILCTTVFVLCLLWGSQAKMTFSSPAELVDISIDAFQFVFLGPKDKINATARVIVADPPKGCDWSKVKNKDDWAGSIVIVERSMCLRSVNNHDYIII